MEIDKIRMKAQAYLQKHEQARAQLKAERTAWKKKHGTGTDQMIVCNKRPWIKELMENEQMYGRWALLYATIATMEMHWEARANFMDAQLDSSIGGPNEEE